MDEFLAWLKKNKEHYALVDKSYKPFLQRRDKISNINDIKINTELATYGDAVLKLALCQILWRENVFKLTEQKKKYEEDETLVKIIAKRYELLDFIKAGSTKPRNYDYEKYSTKKKENNKHKYIATAVEACLGAIYKEEKDMDKVIRIVKLWKDMIDKA